MRRHLIWALLSVAAPALGQGGRELPSATAADSARPAARPWYRPRHLLAQTGSGLGLATVGAGYTFWRDRGEADVLLGFVPRHYAGPSPLLIPALKLLYTPFRVPLSGRLELRPLTLGLYVSHTYGVLNDDRGKYSKGYYWFSADTRVGPLLGGRLSYRRRPTSPEQSRRISAYYELVTNDLYALSYLANGNRRSLGLADLLTLGLGVKVDF